MMVPKNILFFHTAFVGDIILMLPLVQTARRSFPDARISIVAIPVACQSLQHHPAIDEIIPYDKKGRDAGLRGLLRMSRQLKKRKFDIAIVPHRSIRSAVIIRLAGIPTRIGFSTSTGKFLFSDVVQYDRGSHETVRNLSLLGPLGLAPTTGELPDLFPGQHDIEVVDGLIKKNESTINFDTEQLIGVAPGSVWNTKRWPSEYFISLCKMLVRSGYSIALVGGDDDRSLCRDIEKHVGQGPVLNAAGLLTVLQSAELIRRCRVMISNDSAPMHMAVALRTPVVAIYGATVPEFGFAPLGEHDAIMETSGLPCRPCSIHGGEVCPIKTFVCMKNISPENVFEKFVSVLQTVKQPWDSN